MRQWNRIEVNDTEFVTLKNGMPPARRTAVALGLFDGVHRGHQDVLQHTVQAAGNSMSSAVFTFTPGTVKTKFDGHVSLLSPELKWERLAASGMSYCLTPDFSNLQGLSPNEFVRDILRDRMNAGIVVCGEDFRFGKAASAGWRELREMGKNYGMDVLVVPPLTAEGDVISSTRIRKALQLGDMELANRLLGYAFPLRLPVVKGNQLGRTLEFPTINQTIPSGQFLPKFGVYASYTLIEGERIPSITNIGVRPTVSGAREPLAETYILDWTGDLYGQTVEICLTQFIRPEIKFSGLDELKAQVQQDIEEVMLFAGIL